MKIVLALLALEFEALRAVTKFPGPVVVAVARAAEVAEDELVIAIADTAAGVDAVAMAEADAKTEAENEVVDAEAEAEAVSAETVGAVSARIPTCADKLQLELLDTLTKAMEPLLDAMADAEMEL